ncbi:MAG: hypothetical protein NVS9B14_02660 [Candidatus Acidiferrum sp.]
MNEAAKLQAFESHLSIAERHASELRKVPADAEEGADLRSFYRTVRKRRWTILTTAFVIFTVVLIGTVKQRPVYRAQSMIEFRQENPNIVTVRELFQIQNTSDNYLETQYRVLQSDRLAGEVVRRLHLDQVEEFNPPKRNWPWQAKSVRAADPNVALAVTPADEQGVLQRFKESLHIDPIRHSRLAEVSFDSFDRELVAKVVNTLAQSYIEENMQAHWDASQKATEWLSQQLVELKIKLQKSEDDLQQYAQSNGLLFLESSNGGTENIVDERLRQLQDGLTQAQADRYQKESLHVLVEAGNYGSLPGIFDNKLTQDLTGKLADLERQQAEMGSHFNSSYPKMTELQSQIDRIQQLLKQEREQAAQHIENEYLAAVRREGLIRQAFEEQQAQENLVAQKSVQYQILKREVDTNRQLYDGLLQRMKEAGVSAGLKENNIRIVDAAVPPRGAFKPRIPLNLSLALVVGMTFGLGLAFLQERLDNTLKTSDDIEQYLKIPALAVIPSNESLLSHPKKNVHGLLRQTVKTGELTQLEATVKLDWVRIDNNGTHHSPLSEAFRSLRTSVLLSTAGQPPRSLAVVSAAPGEGKTTTSFNLAISLGQLGKRVLLIDCDMRRPRLHRVFHINEPLGLTSYLAGLEGWRSLVRSTGAAGLDCIVCGPVPPNPSELLSCEPMRRLICEAIEVYHFVLLDSPPLLSVADGRILASLADGTILVIKANVTPRELVKRAQSYVHDAGVRLIGAVLNDVNIKRDGYYGYGTYRYGDGQYGEYRDQDEGRAVQAREQQGSSTR